MVHIRSRTRKKQPSLVRNASQSVDLEWYCMLARRPSNNLQSVAGIAVVSIVVARSKDERVETRAEVQPELTWATSGHRKSRQCR
eukprot:4260530-Pyramimonas_sp.AAC.1